MTQLRKVIFWCHLVAGAAAGVVILVMSVTGVLLAYEKQLIRWADTRGYEVSRPSPDAARLPVETLIATAREAQPAAPSSITLYSDADAPASVSLAGGHTLFLDPYTGAVFGEGSPRVRSFFRTVTDWHRWLGAGGESRALGRAVTGAANLLFLFIVASGFYLWWPRKWTRGSLRAVTWFRRGQGGAALSSSTRGCRWPGGVFIPGGAGGSERPSKQRWFSEISFRQQYRNEAATT